jgi:hypothetical protein
MRHLAEVMKKIPVEIIIFTRGNEKEEFFRNIALFSESSCSLE